MNTIYSQIAEILKKGPATWNDIARQIYHRETASEQRTIYMHISILRKKGYKIQAKYNRDKIKGSSATYHLISLPKNSADSA